MNSLLLPVIDAFPKFIIERHQSPSYVEMYSRTNKDEVIRVYIKNKQFVSLASSDSNKKVNESEFELTGSPLKLDLSLHTVLDDTFATEEPQLWNKEEAVHLPLDIENAREIANFYNHIMRQVSHDDSLPMWILCDPTAEGRPLLLTIQSDDKHFARGIVNFEETVLLDDLDVHELIQKYCQQEKITEEMVSTLVEGKYIVSGISYTCNSDEILNAPHGGVTELFCEWTEKTLHVPLISCKVNLEQEVIIGHLASPCNAVWKSVSALHNINQLLVDMMAAGVSAVNLEKAQIRYYRTGMTRPNNKKRLRDLLNETETYAYTEYPPGGCICVTDDTNTLRQCLTSMSAHGSSNDFTYKLWDILRDCESADELITLLLDALTFISSGKIRPFIDANNKTYLSVLMLQLSRGHSQSGKVLKNLKSSPPQVLSMVSQVGIEKTIWEYTKVISLLEHSFLIAGIWNKDSKSQESIEQIHQTIHDMSMSGDFTLNPFETLSTMDQSIRIECNSFYEEDNELTVNDFASLKIHRPVGEKKDVNEVPLIADEIDMSSWKNLLTKFAQVHVCLEHLYRVETCLRVDFGGLKPIASQLLETYVSERSAIKTIGQLLSEPAQRLTLTLPNNIVQDYLKKPASWYRLELRRKDSSIDTGVRRKSKVMYVFSQLPVFPPSVWHNIEPPSDDAEATTLGDIKYYSTKYTFLCNKLSNKLPI